MAYTPNDWACGDIVTAEKLNAIERGISEVNSEYVPTEWQCGDVITAEAMNKIEQGIANAEGGGSGSGDFSTAQVTVAGNSVNMSLPLCLNDGEMTALFVVLQRYRVGTYEIALWKGSTFIEISDEVSVEVSGDAEDMGGGMYLITGDCTITIS